MRSYSIRSAPSKIAFWIHYWFRFFDSESFFRHYILFFYRIHIKIWFFFRIYRFNADSRGVILESSFSDEWESLIPDSRVIWRKKNQIFEFVFKNFFLKKNQNSWIWILLRLYLGAFILNSDSRIQIYCRAGFEFLNSELLVLNSDS